MIKKYYFADVVKTWHGGSLSVGSATISVWFWRSARQAYDMMTDDLRATHPNDHIVNFRRVK